MRTGEFIETVLALRPQIAVFDCDGTLWAADSGQEFFHWEIEQALLPEEVARWALQRNDDYLAGKVGEEEMCGDMVAIHAGLPEADLERAARRFCDGQIAGRIFPEMQALTHRLAEAGCRLWAVSSTNEWVVRAGVAHFGIPRERVLAACVEIEQGCATRRLLRVPTGEGKAAALREVLGSMPDLAFGNSLHDVAMLEMARHAFAVNPSPDLEILARARGWTVYLPAGAGVR